jgi:hypothetical protein
MKYSGIENTKLLSQYRSASNYNRKELTKKNPLGHMGSILANKRQQEKFSIGWMWLMWEKEGLSG